MRCLSNAESDPPRLWARRFSGAEEVPGSTYPHQKGHAVNTVPKLHDATLETLTVHWVEGTVRIGLSTGINGTGVVTLEAIGVRRAVCPRAFPWGPSDSVNEVRLEQVSEGRLLSIEMQSGDVLEICCKDVLVEQAEE